MVVHETTLELIIEECEREGVSDDPHHRKGVFFRAFKEEEVASRQIDYGILGASLAVVATKTNATVSCALQHAATCCNTLQHTATYSWHSRRGVSCRLGAATKTNATVGCTLQHAATRCNTLQHAATRCNTLQHAATRCNTLQHAATRCSILMACRARRWLLSLPHIGIRRVISCIYRNYT